LPADSDGDGVPDCGGDTILPEAQFRGVPAVFQGYEAQGRVRLLDGPGSHRAAIRRSATSLCAT